MARQIHLSKAQDRTIAARRRVLATTGVAAATFGTAFAAVALITPHPRLVWNASASVPLGLYRVQPISAASVGDLVVIQPPPGLARMLAKGHYLPLRLPMLKHVAATAGSTICRTGASITIDGQAAAQARGEDRLGRPLPVWRGCRTIGVHQLFLLNPAPDSLDGRYFGAVSDEGLRGRATPLLTRDAPGSPLRWRAFSVEAPEASLAAVAQCR